MELLELLRTLRSSWWMLTIGVVGGAAVGLGLSLAQTPLYSSTTQFFVSTSDTASTAEAFQGSQFSQQRVASYARLLTGEEMAGRVINRLDLDMPVGELADAITATADPNTVLLDVQVEDSSPTVAQEIALAIGEEFPSMVAELESSPVKVTVTDEPKVPVAPSEPNTIRNVALASLLGLGVGAGSALLRSVLDRSVRDSEAVATITGAPLLGTVLRDDILKRKHVIAGSEQSRTAEDYRRLRTNLQFINVDNPPKTIMVTSALPSEGKTTLVVNLAWALAEIGRRVIVVEADLRRPKVTRYLGLVGGVGLTNLLAGTAELEEVRQEYGAGGYSVVGAGPTPPNPGELLSSSSMVTLLRTLRDQYDVVLVDVPPLLPVADSTGVASSVDGVLLSVHHGETTRDQLKEAAATLDRVGARTLGVILNIVPPNAEIATGYGYGYTYAPEINGRGGKRRS